MLSQSFIMRLGSLEPAQVQRHADVKCDAAKIVAGVQQLELPLDTTTLPWIDGAKAVTDAFTPAMRYKATVLMVRAQQDETDSQSCDRIISTHGLLPRNAITQLGGIGGRKARRAISHLNSIGFAAKNHAKQHAKTVNFFMADGITRVETAKKIAHVFIKSDGHPSPSLRTQGGRRMYSSRPQRR
jgi:hypothetical protein